MTERQNHEQIVRLCNDLGLEKKENDTNAFKPCTALNKSYFCTVKEKIF